LYQLGQTSRKRLEGVEAPLVRVVERAIKIARQDFCVIDGRRDAKTQKHYFETGKSKTMDSLHLTGHAVDLAVYGTIDQVTGKQGCLWQPWELYEELAETMFRAAHIEGEVIQWGGHFCRVKMDGRLIPFLDGVHFQLPRDLYLRANTSKPVAKATNGKEEAQKVRKRRRKAPPPVKVAETKPKDPPKPPKAV